MEVDSNNPKLIWKVRMPSKSSPGEFHVVEVYDSGDIRCDCLAAEMSKVCDHMRKTRDFIEVLSEKISNKYPKKDYPTKIPAKVTKVIPTGDPPKKAPYED